MVKTDDTTKKKPAAKKVAAEKPAKHADETKHAEPVKHAVKKAPAKKVAAKKTDAKESAKDAAEAKPVATAEVAVTIETAPEVEQIKFAKPTISGGRYVFATGRRKTAIANIRLFSGKGDSVINKKTINKYFEHKIFQDELAQPFQLTGLGSDFYFTAHIAGGGIHAQAQALRHALAQALASMNDEIRAVLKKNGLLTRDDRKKERKKPGLRRARRSPQWAKR